MKISEIAPNAQDTNTLIRELKIRTYNAPDVDAIRKQITPALHDVNDVSIRPDKAVKDDNGRVLRIEKINRISLDFEDLIVRKAVNFALGNPVIRRYNHPDTDTNAKIIEQYLERVLHDNMSLLLDREMATTLATWQEAAEYWYPKEGKEHDKYGFKTKWRLKAVLFSAENGNTLFPKFDSYMDLIALSREYEIKNVNVVNSYFQTFTSDEIVTWRRNGLGAYDEIERIPLKIGKMPIIYGRQKETEFKKIETIRPRLELLLSNNAEVNDYHSGPKILVSGDIEGWGQKGQNNMILQAKEGADAKYLSWDSAPESVKNEINNLLLQMYALTQTPNISFDNIKGMGAVSGLAIKLLFLDAHLKVKDKESIYLPFFQRRQRVICAYVGVFQTNQALTDAAEDFEVDNELDPFMIADEKEKAEITLALNGNQPVKSQLSGVKEYGGDQTEYDQIIAEEKERAMSFVTEPTL